VPKTSEEDFSRRTMIDDPIAITIEITRRVTISSASENPLSSP
jgi:hypothetical protein